MGDYRRATAANVVRLVEARIREIIAALFVLVSLVGAPTTAAEPDQFLASLAAVPDSADTRSRSISYVDYRAVELGRPGAARPASIAELLALRGTNDPSVALWHAAVNGIVSGSGDLLRGLITHGPEWPRRLGFDFFDVDRELTFGAAPSDGRVFSGDFDVQAIGRAFSDRGYTGRKIGGHVRWCGPTGCDQGRWPDFDFTDPAIPFGGELGILEPMAVSESALLAAADIDTVDGMILAMSGMLPSLAQDPAYRAAIESIDPAARLIQATLLPARVLEADVAAVFEDPVSDDLHETLARTASTFEAIPRFQLAMVADMATATEQVALIALVYDWVSDAQVAADAVVRRMDTMESLVYGAPIRDLLAKRHVSSVSARVHGSDDGTKAVALVELRAPLAPQERDETSGLFVPSSGVYQLLTEMALRRDALWLAPTLPALE